MAKMHGDEGVIIGVQTPSRPRSLTPEGDDDHPEDTGVGNLVQKNRRLQRGWASPRRLRGCRLGPAVMWFLELEARAQCPMPLPPSTTPGLSAVSLGPAGSWSPSRRQALISCSSEAGGCGAGGLGLCQTSSRCGHSCPLARLRLRLSANSLP
uniref:Uncharacterized protein n=1 Tax=Rangifer tarandus platyrhynchus TaxID=3082113 RepID=A0ACB0F2K1_RANTA|nr:unnamed protein product [Rangifer tarandus platyrhynchus]